MRPRLKTVADARLRTPANIGSHLDHQEDGEGNAHKQRRKLRLVVDKQLIGEFENSRHGRSSPWVPSDTDWPAGTQTLSGDHHFEIGDLAFDRYLLQRARPFSRALQGTPVNTDSQDGPLYRPRTAPEKATVRKPRK